jgi:putative ABC transport system substrate-binding protein
MIGFMGSGAAAAQGRWTAAVMERLQELGWAEGRNVAIDYRWADGSSERFAEIAAEFVRQNVDLILTHNTLPTLAAKQATSTIPIVFAAVGDPVANGLVASLAHPGGNITGLSTQTPDAAGKRLELLREIIPSLRRLAVMGDANSPVTKSDVREVEEAARNAAVELIAFEVGQEGDVERIIEAVKGRAQALYVTISPTMFVNRNRINTLALAARLPTMHSAGEYVGTTGLMSYGPNWPHMWRRAADLIDKVLRRARLADIAVEQSTKFDLVVNLTTAKALRLAIPPALLARADEIIE